METLFVSIKISPCCLFDRRAEEEVVVLGNIKNDALDHQVGSPRNRQVTEAAGLFFYDRSDVGNQRVFSPGDVDSGFQPGATEPFGLSRFRVDDPDLALLFPVGLQVLIEELRRDLRPGSRELELSLVASPKILLRPVAQGFPD